MHVCYIMGQDSGGLPHYTAELANAVVEHAEVTVLKPSETSADDIFDPRVTVRNAFEPTDISMQNIFDLNLNVRSNLRGLYSYRNIELVNDIDPDIVHDPTDEFPQVTLFAYLNDVYEDRPYVLTVHEVEHGDSEGLFRIADMVISATPEFHKDAIVVHSDEQQSVLEAQEREYGSAYTIPHGVYTFFRDCDYTPQPTEENHALFFGSLIPPKGIEFLIEAVPHVVDQIPDFQLTIAGKGSIPDHCDRTLREYSDHITVRNEFIDNDEVGELFTSAQVVTLPYRNGWQTGHSGTLSVALAFGKPIVASDVGSFSELVDGNGAGVVAEPENPEAIAEGIVTVLEDETRRTEMADASAALADELSWENVGKQHVEMYEELV